jgi:hypothetical protein
MTSYRCDGCGVTNRASNDLSGMAHTTTGGKPSECEGRYRLAIHTPTRVDTLAGAQSPKPVEGVPGDTSPGVLADQLALTLDDAQRIADPPSRLAEGHRGAA